MLTLYIISTNLNFNQNEFIIYPNGLVNSNRFNAKDGLVFFGINKKYCDFIFPMKFNKNKNIENNNNNNENNDNNEKNEKNENKIENNEKNEKIENNENIINKNENIINNNNNENYYDQSPFFVIYFNILDESYYIKDTNKKIGALMKITSFEIKNNILLNIGSTYLVITFDFIKLKLTIKIFNNDVIQNKNIKENYDKKIFIFSDKENSIVNIGRCEQSDLFINDFNLSRNHCYIIYYFESKKLMIVDGDYNNSSKFSSHGTWVYISHSQKIENNFEFKINHTKFKILCSNFESIETENENINDNLI